MNGQDRLDAAPALGLRGPLSIRGGLATLREQGLDFFYVHQAALRADVDKDGSCAEPGDARHRGEKSKGRDDDRVAGAYSQSHQREQQRVASRSDADGITASEMRRRLRFESLHCFSQNKLLRLDHLVDRPADLSAYPLILRLKVEKRDLDRGCFFFRHGQKERFCLAL